MTPRMISTDRRDEIAAQTEARARMIRTYKAVASDPAVARMDQIDHRGQADRADDGCLRLRSGVIGDVIMNCRVTEMGGELLIEFYAPSTGHSRRFLVTAGGRILMQDGDLVAVPTSPRCKYHAAIHAILRERLQ